MKQTIMAKHISENTITKNDLVICNISDDKMIRILGIGQHQNTSFFNSWSTLNNKNIHKKKTK